MTIQQEIQALIQAKHATTRKDRVVKVVTRNYSRKSKGCYLCGESIYGKCREVHINSPNDDPDIVHSWFWVHFDFGACTFRKAVRT